MAVSLKQVHHGSLAPFPVSILHKSIAGRYRPVRVADGPTTACYRFIKNAGWAFSFNDFFHFECRNYKHIPHYPKFGILSFLTVSWEGEQPIIVVVDDSKDMIKWMS